MANSTGVREKLDSVAKSTNYVVLAKVDAKKYQETNLEIIKYLTTEQNTAGVYVTLNKPFKTMLSLFANKGIDSKMIIFIDAVTKTTESQIEKKENCLFIGNPENLSDISLAMDQAVRSIPGKDKFLFFDSLDTLLIYNGPAIVAKFIHFLSGKMREWSVKGIIVSLSRESNKELLQELSQFCDMIWEL